VAGLRNVMRERSVSCEKQMCETSLTLCCATGVSYPPWDQGLLNHAGGEDGGILSSMEAPQLVARMTRGPACSIVGGKSLGIQCWEGGTW
jgi:hypothetical protein